MSTFLIDAVRLSCTRPREGMRIVLSRVTGLEGLAVLFGLAFCLTSILLIMRWMLVGGPGVVGGEGGIFLNLVMQLISSGLVFAVLVGAIFIAGRMFGGAGTALSIGIMLSWHSLLTAVFAPFLTIPSLAADGGGVSMVQIAMIAFSTWLLVNFIAEVHQFRSAWRVAGVIFGVMFGASFVLLFLTLGTR